jgi:DMSO/TMAO reductase YedYZ molybdopterin-dependent catalytic subunit/thiosulfate reductase cytochrome b subunit
MDTFDRRLNPAEDWIDRKEWTPPKQGIAPEVRLLGRWWNVGWLCLFAWVFLIVFSAGSTWFIETETGKAFVGRYPATLSRGPASEAQGFPWWLRWEHYFNLFIMVLMIRSGISILADHPRLYWNVHCTPGTEWFRFNIPVPKMPYYTAKDDSVTIPGWLGLPGIRHSGGIARWWHFSCALFWILNGLVFVILLFATNQWQRLVPRTWEIIPSAAATAVQYASLHMPHENGWVRYNALQQLGYFAVVFIAAPLQILTGLAMAPSVGNRLRRFSILLHRQRARSIHFLGLLFFLGFVLIHVTMVFVTGFRKNLNHIVMGTDEGNWNGFIWALVGIGVIVLVWIAATWITMHRSRLVQRVGRLIVGRITFLMEWFSPNSQYKECDVSPHLWPNGTLPQRELWDRLLQRGPQGCTLKVFGRVAHPQEFTVDQLREIGFCEQITEHYCIQGWSGIAKWGGTPMAKLLELVKPDPSARYAVFYSYADGADGGRYYDVHTLSNMKHELTLLAYEMNGRPLDIYHGAPLRLRCENELGFKQVKWIEAIEFVEDYKKLGAGQGGYNEDHEFYSWRAPI